MVRARENSSQLSEPERAADNCQSQREQQTTVRARESSRQLLEPERIAVNY